MITTPTGINDRPALDAGLRGTGAKEMFPGYVGAREVFRGTYLATPRGTSETVVLRIVPVRNFADPRAHHRYGANLDRASHLRVPGVTPVFGRGTTADGRTFQARSHVAGVPIDVYARGQAFGLTRPPEIRLVLERFVAAARAVHRAHLAGVLHGGIKPTNILTDVEGTTQVLDFGLNLPAVADLSDDVAALGRLLFELLRQRDEPPDRDLIAIATRATAADPRQTFGTAGAMADAIDGYLHGRRTGTGDTTLAESARAWLTRRVERPRWLPAIGSAGGLLAGWVAAWAAFAARPVPAPLFAITVLATLGAGALAAQVARARGRVGGWITGLTVGLIGGLFAWAAGAGGAISAAIHQPAMLGPQRLAEAWPLRAEFAVGSHDIPADHPQDRIVEKYPELVAVPEADRPARLQAAWHADLRAASARAGVIAPLMPVLIGLGLCLIGATAWQSSQRGMMSMMERAATYFELSLPGQLAVAATGAAVITRASGLPAIAPWPACVGLAAFAVGIAGLIRGGVPLVTRVACYLAGIALCLRVAGDPFPIWVDGHALLVAVILCVNYVRSFRPPLYPPAD